MTALAEPHPTERERTTLALEGMTCASCATRIERSLNKLDGVEATVNFATESATVSYEPDRIAPARLVDAVESIGYHAAPAHDQHAAHGHGHHAPATRLLLAVTVR